MEKIPKEILIEILGSLPFSDLKRARLVCQRFLDAGSERKLWKNFILYISRGNLSKLDQIAELKIMQDLKRVIFTGCAIKNEHVKILFRKNIKYLQLGSNHDVENDCDITNISPKILANLMTNLEVFKFHNSLMSEMSEKQSIAILKQLNKKSSISTLEILYNNHLCSIAPEPLASALTSVTELTLVFQKLNADKYDAIFYHIYKKSNLKVVNLPGNNLSKVNPDLFGSAISKLESSNLCDTNISIEMINNLFSKISRSKGPVKIQKIDLSHNCHLKHVPPQLFSECVSKLSSINLKQTCLQETQLSSLMELVVSRTSESCLSEVNLSAVSSLNKVDPELLASFISRLTQATLYATKLSTMQLSNILMKLINENHGLILLDIGGSNLSSVPHHLISSCIQTIENVNLYFTKLTTNQQIEILQSLGCSKLGKFKLKYLDIGGNQGNIPENILENAEMKIGTVKLMT